MGRLSSEWEGIFICGFPGGGKIPSVIQWRWSVLATVLLLSSVALRADLPMTLLTEPTAGRTLEIRIAGVPTVANPFDPDLIRLDATVTGPSGRIWKVPAFWYQGYTRRLSGDLEVLSLTGPAHWRLRFLPPEVGAYVADLRMTLGGQESPESGRIEFSVAAPTGAGPGMARVLPGRPFLVADQDRPIPLVGANLCWPGSRGTFDYDRWIPALATNGGNFARLWMAPWAFGVEAEPGTLTRYRLDRAWQLDQVLDLAASREIYVMLCLEYHGMFSTTPDSWGGNDNWKNNPYNASLGGPAANPNVFFANAEARRIYQKRLRYLVARYGAFPQLLCWEFLNEIDNVYGNLRPADVAAWHGVMGSWLKTNDPFGHLITTSLTGGSDRSDIWSLPQLDFTQFHAYGEPDPATTFAAVSTRLRSAYGKPVVIGEFGVDFRGWMRSADPFLRGFRQGLWGGALGGSAGTAMSWWWENLYDENVYPLLGAVRDILGRTHWGRGEWSPVTMETSGLPPPTVGDVLPNGAPFPATLIPNGTWAARPRGSIALADVDSAAEAGSLLNGFVHGSSHPDLRTPFKVQARFAAESRFVAHVNSVSQGARLAFYVDGSLVLSTNLPDRDGKFDALANEYNVDIGIAVSEGRHTVELRNPGNDWLFLDWVRAEPVRPSSYSGGWQPTLPAVGLRGEQETLLYVTSPLTRFPSGATRPDPAVQSGRTLTLTNWPAGTFEAQWFQATNAARAGATHAVTTEGRLTLLVPDFSEDLAAVVLPVPELQNARLEDAAAFRFEVHGAADYPFVVERSPDLMNWGDWLTGTNSTSPTVVEDSPTAGEPRVFYRARNGRL